MKLGKDSGLAGPQVYPQVYAVLPLLKNASDLVHPQPSYCPNSSLSEGVPVLSTSEFSLSIPSRTRPCEASALTRPPKRCYRGRRRLHAGKCHGQGAVPCPLAGAAHTAEAQPLLLADDARGRGPPLSQGASAAAAPSPGRAPRFSVRPSRFHDLLKSARRGAQPLDPPHAGIPPGPPVAMPYISLGTPELPASMSGPTCPPSRSSRSISAGLAL